jgi:hypothetical protein
MRLSTLSLLCVLLLTPVAFAQHHESGSAPSAPASNPAPSPSLSSAPSISHSAPSAPAPVSAPAFHSAPVPSPSPSPMHSSMPSSATTSNSARSAPESKPQSDAAGNGQARTPAADKIVSDDRASQSPAIKRPVESDLRHRVCAGGKCPDVSSEAQNDALRHCLTAECKCPPGQSQGKGGCVANPTNPPVTKTGTCAAGSAWNGSSCVPTNEICPAGQSWDGARCTIASCAAGKVLRAGACMEDCSLTNAQAYARIPEVQSARRDRDDACQQGLATTQCQQADGHYQNILAEYRMLWAAAPAECRAPLPVPDTL